MCGMRRRTSSQCSLERLGIRTTVICCYYHASCVVLCRLQFVNGNLWGSIAAVFYRRMRDDDSAVTAFGLFILLIIGLQFSQGKYVGLKHQQMQRNLKTLLLSSHEDALCKLAAYLLTYFLHTVAY